MKAAKRVRIENGGDEVSAKALKRTLSRNSLGGYKRCLTCSDLTDCHREKRPSFLARTCFERIDSHEHEIAPPSVDSEDEDFLSIRRLSSTDEEASRKSLEDKGKDNSIVIVDCVRTEDTCKCFREIFCYGPLLHAAQYAYIFNDSKSFVDMHMKYEQDKVFGDFAVLLNKTSNRPTADQVHSFVCNYFTVPDSEFELWTPADWKETPKFLSRVKDPILKSWAVDLNARWKDLGRRIKNDVRLNPNRYSIIYSPNPVVVPGGRFREFYYWDNYWIIRGLLLSEMYDTAKGTIRNFFDMVKRFGYVPNGGRLYYSRRSQPPFLTLMVREYIQETGDYEFLKEALPGLQTEHVFWERDRSVVVQDSDGKPHSLSRYGSDVNQPRPESYREDYELVHDHKLSQADKLELMTHVTSACESGWDFSSRWTGARHEKGSNVLLELKTRDIVPVDLNSILAAVEKTLSEFNKQLGRTETATAYLEKYRNRVDGIEKIHWHEEDGTYYDYVISKASHNRQYFLSNATPLWTKSYPYYVDVEKRERKMLEYFKALEHDGVCVLDFPGGVPTSLNHSGEQWDFPNAWPPIVHMLIEGMALSKVGELQDEAVRQSRKWIKTGYRGFSNPGYDNAMFEKYNVLRDDGLPGSGGEYGVQEGFGWTNGVAMILLDSYGEILKVDDDTSTSSSNQPLD